MKTKAWKDIWGSGQGIGGIEAVDTIETVVSQMEREFKDAVGSLTARAS
jgi:nitronate monooxygenase